MKLIAGAIVVLAGSIVMAAGFFGAEYTRAAGKTAYNGQLPAFLGTAIAVAGFWVLAKGWREQGGGKNG